MFKGVFTAVVTPFKGDKIDYDSYYAILDRQIQSNVTGIVPCGTTGESPTLSFEEHRELIKRTVEHVKGRKLVVAGTGSNSTAEAIYLTEKANEDGVDAILSVNPYYNKPTQEGLYRHFEEIAKISEKPIMLYNIPGRTAVNLLPETICRLAEHSKIVAVKEASGNLQQMAKLISLSGDELDILSGDDTLTLPLLSIGGVGVVSVVSNLFPNSVAKVVSLFQENKLAESKKLFYELFPVFTLAFCETNPIPLKAAMSWLGYCQNEVRLPMTPLSHSKDAEELKKEVFLLRDKGYT
jgi:4-hydroxy-tetrahydrodipicolinate synthase